MFCPYCYDGEVVIKSKRPIYDYFGEQNIHILNISDWLECTNCSEGRWISEDDLMKDIERIKREKSLDGSKIRLIVEEHYQLDLDARDERFKDCKTSEEIYEKIKEEDLNGRLTYVAKSYKLLDRYNYSVKNDEYVWRGQYNGCIDGKPILQKVGE